jgi:hypothetical protein
MTRLILPLILGLSSCKSDKEKVTEKQEPGHHETDTSKESRQDRLDKLTSIFRAKSPPTELRLDRDDVNLLLMTLRKDAPVDQENWETALIIGVGSDGIDIDQILMNHVREIASSQTLRSQILKIIEARRQRSSK